MNAYPPPNRRFSRAPNLRFALVLIALVALNRPSSLYATDGTWINSAFSPSENWSTASNWLSNTIGDGVGSTVFINPNIGGSRTVIIDGNISRTVGILDFGQANAVANLILSATGTAVLNFDTGSAANAQLNLTGRNDSISAPIRLANSLNINYSKSFSVSLTGGISASTAGTKTITNSGTGTGIITFLTNSITDGVGQIAIRQNSANTALSIQVNNTYTGGTTLDAGRLGITGGSALGTGTVTLNGGTLANDATGQATVAAPITLGGNVNFIGTTGGTSSTTRLVLGGTMTLTGNREITVSGTTNALGGGYVSITNTIVESGGSFSLTKTGDGELRLEQGSGKAPTYTGGTFVNQGTLKMAAFANVQTLPTTGAVTINGGILDVATTAAAVDSIGALNLISGSVIGTAGTSTLSASSYSVSSGLISKKIGGASSVLTKITAGTVTLSGTNNTYGGATIINGGVLSVTTLANGGTVSRTGTSSAVATNLVLDGGVLQYTGGTASTNRNFQVGSTVDGGTGTIDASGSGALTISGTAAYGTADQTRSVVFTGSNAGTLSGSIGNNGSGAVSVTKSGNGNWTLAGSNSYTGGTTVNAGQLIISGGISGDQNVTVAAAATLDLAAVSNLTISTGRAFGANGSVTAPTTGGLTIANGATLSGTGTISNAATVAGTVTPHTDGLIGTLNTGALTLSGNYKLDLNSTSGVADLIVSDGTLTLGGMLIAGTDLAGGVGGFGTAITILQSTSSITGMFSNTQITFGSMTYDIGYTATEVLLTAVPEPGTWAMFLGGLGALVSFRRVRRRL